MEARTFNSDLESQLRALLERLLRESRVPGLSTVLSCAGQTVKVSVGVAATDRDTPLSNDHGFELGCVNKMIMALAALQSAQDHLLDLTAPLHRYLPELQPLGGCRNVAVWHLLSHTSGHVDFFNSPGSQGDWLSFVQFLRDSASLFEPGRVFSYQNSPSVLLAEILERVHRRPLRELLENILFARLDEGEDSGPTSGNMRVVRHVYDAQSRTYQPLREIDANRWFWQPAISTAGVSLSQLIRFISDLMNTEDPRQRALLQTLCKPVVSLPSLWGVRQARLLPTAYGLGVACFARGFFGHDSSVNGQTLGIRFDPARRFALAVGINAQTPRLRRALLETIISKFYGPLRHKAQAMLPDDLPLREISGVYSCRAAQQAVVSTESDRLIHVRLSERDTAVFNVKIDVAAPESPGIPDGPDIPIGFFRNRASGDPCLMVGMSALKRLQ